ncbi:MAG: hypothetical protein ACYDEI_00270 [Erysipelotrichaceae bacterium]
MVNTEIKNVLFKIESEIEQLEIGLSNNFDAGIWYSSKEYHERLLDKLEIIKKILDL